MMPSISCPEEFTHVREAFLSLPCLPKSSSDQTTLQLDYTIHSALGLGCSVVVTSLGTCPVFTVSTSQ